MSLEMLEFTCCMKMCLSEVSVQRVCLKKQMPLSVESGFVSVHSMTLGDFKSY